MVLFGQPVAVLSSAALETVAGYREMAALAEVEAMVQTVIFCKVNEATDPGAAATLSERGRVTDVPLAGVGAPWLSEVAVVEFAAVMGMSTDQARSYLGDALEVAYRLPATWVPPTRASEHSPDRSAWLARCSATSADEQAVSTVTAGPSRPSVYATRPDSTLVVTPVSMSPSRLPASGELTSPYPVKLPPAQIPV